MAPQSYIPLHTTSTSTTRHHPLPLHIIANNSAQISTTGFWLSGRPPVLKVRDTPNVAKYSVRVPAEDARRWMVYSKSSYQRGFLQRAGTPSGLLPSQSNNLVFPLYAPFVYHTTVNTCVCCCMWSTLYFNQNTIQDTLPVWQLRFSLASWILYVMICFQCKSI
jgi:hypothetical protein